MGHIEYDLAKERQGYSSGGPAILSRLLIQGGLR